MALVDTRKELLWLMVKPAHQFRGLGSALVKDLQGLHKSLRLTCCAKTTRFYARLGFEIIDLADDCRINMHWSKKDVKDGVV